MELAYSPKAAVEKKYKHYTVKSFAERELIADKKKEFFYIGTDSFIIGNLVHSFESGYAAESVEKAISILTKVTEKRNIYPDLILADASLGIAALTTFFQFLSGSKSLESIPFLVETSGANAKDLNELRKLPFVDEIISMHQQADKLQSKIYFIKKIKGSNNIKKLEQNITHSVDTNAVIKDLFKRCFDVVIASFILLVLSPVFLFIALAIRLESRGPVFYVAKRAGRGYRVFNFYKFRTMETDADTKVDELSHLNQYNNATSDKGPVFYKLNNDPRVNKVGSFLRNTSLDELPQFFNVLLGDMSLVGNRPLPLYEAATLTTDEWAARFMAPAGITGLWQVTKRSHDMSVEERISLDIAYANKYNFMYDLWIMANTPTALIQKSGV